MNKITTHELARELLELGDVPVIHVYTHWDNFDDNPCEYQHTIGINPLQDDNGNLIEVGLYPEETISMEGFSDDEEEE
uniref:Uncharacterized protein n=1 Tax=Vibrio phage P018-4 TaxID=3229728 RepID=A0AB39AJF5_9CAUD